MPKAPKKHPLLIAVLDRGWVFVGRCETVADVLTIHNAACVRYWGTTRGLGEIALCGPTATTRLDESGLVRVPIRSLICTLACEEAKWNR